MGTRPRRLAGLAEIVPARDAQPVARDTGMCTHQHRGARSTDDGLVAHPGRD
jgi:hypothetical protein